MAVPWLAPSQLAAIVQRSGLRDAGALVRAVLRCGFDPAGYLTRNRDLRDAGFGAAAALVHFLEYGYAEARMPPAGPLPDGLDTLLALNIPDRTYAQTLFRALFTQQVRHPATTERVWQLPATVPVDRVRTMGGLPYVIIGDSHATHYARDAAADRAWLAGVPLVCFGASAAGLALNETGEGFGPAIMRWAEAAAPLDLPVFLKFGGIDAEFRWMAQRIRTNSAAFSDDEFDRYAERAVADYGRFLDRLTATLCAGRIRVCSVFPTALRDRFWIEGFVNATAGSPDRQPALRATLGRMEIPDFPTRTRLRAAYNTRLRALCEAKGLAFLDDFTPFLNASGVLDDRFIASHGSADFHLDYDAIGDLLEPLVHASIAGG